MEHDYQNEISITSMAATIAEIAGIAPPEKAAEPVRWLANAVQKAIGGRADKMLIFSADAVPLWLIRKHTEWFEPVYRHAPISLPLRSVMPTVTPVNYAALFSGVPPELNGVDRIVPPILSPELTQPLIQCDTLIAAAVRAGLRTAVITCANGCIASMLSRSGADFYIIDGDDDQAMFEKALEIVQNNQHDLVFLYQLGFDYAMHRHGPESTEATAVLQTIIKRFDTLCRAVCQSWRGRRLVVFNSDHGCHLRQDGCGSHGLDISEDTDIMHFFGGVTDGECDN